MKNKKQIIRSIAALSALLCILSGIAFFQWFGSERAWVDKKTVTYGFTVRNLTGQPIEDTNVFVYAPVKESAFHQLLSLEASMPYELILESEETQLLEFNIQTLPPFGTKIINIRVTVEFSDIPVTNWSDFLRSETKDQYLQAAPYIETNHKNIQNQAAQFSDASDQEVARKTFNWVSNRITNKGYIERDRGALYALETGVGDCTEFMYLYTTLARVNGIPTRGVAGFVVTENGVLEPGSYHNWAQSYINGVWRNIDPDRKVFMQGKDRYLGFRTLGNNLEKNNSGNSQRIAYVEKEMAGVLSISMNQAGRGI